MTIAGAAMFIGLSEFALALTGAHPPNPEPPVPAEIAGSDCALESFLPVFYTTGCFELEDLRDRNDCLRIDLEDQAVAYSTGVENYHRPVRVRRLTEPEPVHWKTVSPPPFRCQLR
jgi:hypothetical protein